MMLYIQCDTRPALGAITEDFITTIFLSITLLEHTTYAVNGFHTKSPHFEQTDSELHTFSHIVASEND